MAKRSFTMMELLLVVALIGLTLGTIAIQFPKALQGERFERGVDQVKSRIALAQELMLNYQTDVYLQMTPGERGLVCNILAEKPLPERVKKSVNRHAEILGIESVEFDHQPAAYLHFDGTVGATPKGLLVLKGKNREARLTLKGFPSQIMRGDHVAQDSQAAYPEEVLPLI